VLDKLLGAPHGKPVCGHDWAVEMLHGMRYVDLVTSTALFGSCRYTLRSLAPE